MGGPSKTCWKKAYGRGIGTTLSQCEPNEDKVLALCYPKCTPGYTGVGPMCYQDCPQGYPNFLAFCNKPQGYGRGVGSYTECENCEKWGFMWYPKCKEGYYAFACCMCQSKCPEGMSDLGLTCNKKMLNRGMGHPLTCKPEEDQELLVCYPKCTGGTWGLGPVCWGSCPAGLTQCGALCLDQGETCSQYISGMVKQGLTSVISAASENVPGTVINVAQLV